MLDLSKGDASVDPASHRVSFKAEAKIAGLPRVSQLMDLPSYFLGLINISYPALLFFLFLLEAIDLKIILNLFLSS